MQAIGRRAGDVQTSPTPFDELLSRARQHGPTEVEAQVESDSAAPPTRQPDDIGLRRLAAVAIVGVLAVVALVVGLWRAGSADPSTDTRPAQAPLVTTVEPGPDETVPDETVPAETVPAETGPVETGPIRNAEVVVEVERTALRLLDTGSFTDGSISIGDDVATVSFVGDADGAALLIVVADATYALDGPTDGARLDIGQLDAGISLQLVSLADLERLGLPPPDGDCVETDRARLCWQRAT